VAPLPLVADPVGQFVFAPAADGALVPEFPPPHAARPAVIATANPAMNLRLMSVFLRMINR
jgi:hypothetical protein